MPHRNLGCRFLYHWSAGVGANVTERLTVTAQLQHMSNVLAGCTPNDGMNHFGVSRRLEVLTVPETPGLLTLLHFAL